MVITLTTTAAMAETRVNGRSTPPDGGAHQVRRCRPRVGGRCGRISDERFYELLNLAIDEYRTFSKSPTVSG